MQAIFHVSEEVDDAGVATYCAMLPNAFDADGVPLPDAVRGYGETIWAAIMQFCARADLAGLDSTDCIFMDDGAL